MLKEYAATGCPVSIGWYWKSEELKAALAIGPHVSVMEDDAIAQVHIEAREKVKQGLP